MFKVNTLRDEHSSSFFLSAIGAGLFFILVSGFINASPEEGPPNASIAPIAPTPLASLIDSVAQRIAIADQVALSKWDNNQPIADPQREQHVLADPASHAANYHLSPDHVSRFFSDQIEANKLVQYVLFANWLRFGSAPATTRLDLKRDIRPKLDQLQVTLLQQLEQSIAMRHQTECAKTIAEAAERYTTQHPMDALHRIALDRALANVCEH